MAAGRSRDGSLVLLALACLAVGFLMLGHGLTTPGIAGRPPNLWVGRLPVLAIAGFAAGLCAAAWPQRWPARWAGRWPGGTLAGGVSPCWGWSRGRPCSGRRPGAACDRCPEKPGSAWA